MSDIAYAVHTATCTYLLDEDGICRWAQAAGHPGGAAPPGADRCVGAQFVACVDVRAEGGLVGDLRLGGSALFVRSEGARMVMLRTLPIERVEVRAAPEATPAVADPQTEPFPSFAFNAEETEVLDPAEPEEVLDLEDLLSISVTEITVSLPHYRPPSLPRPHAPPVRVPPPGRPPR